MPRRAAAGGILLFCAIATLAGCDGSSEPGGAPVVAEQPSLAAAPAPARAGGHGMPRAPATVPAELTLTPVDYEALPGWSEDDATAVVPALLRSCRQITAERPEFRIGPGGLAGSAADWLGPCREAELLPRGNDAAVRSFVQKWFRPYAVSNSGHDSGTFTGYYEAELRGARAPDARYGTPLYRRPADLLSVDLGGFRADLEGEVVTGRLVDGALLPYHTRAEIDDGALAGQGAELIWVDDPVDAFFLHIQGSGRVILPDGKVVRVGYAANNGYPFFGIAKTLIESGELAKEDASMQSVRSWLRSHPREARELMQRNRRYIFFQEIEGDGPIGALGVALTPERSLAVDPAYVPLGVPLWLDTTWPGGTAEAGRPLRRLMVAQDTGGAIKGAVRGDVYWGSGEPALAIAGGMKQPGRYFLLLPKTVAAARQPAG